MLGNLGGMGGFGIGGGGGALGGSGLDISPHKLPLIGAFFTDPAEQAKQEQFHRMALAYGAYRPEIAQARMNALRNATSAFQGANDLLATFRRGGGVNPAQLYQNPMGPTMMAQGQSSLPQAAGGAAAGGSPLGGIDMLTGLPNGMSPFGRGTGFGLPGM